jgi:nitrite reductase/ring-hydroxylating ferredoxin subunit
MTPTRSQRFQNLVAPERGLVTREIFSDPEIYRLELERIFARAWNFVAHDSQIPNPGDFFMNFIGEDRVIVVRDNDGEPQVLVNSCRHRGNAVCRAEEGHATSFMCTYHGWTYDLKGALVGVPGFKEVYHEELERENWGLIRARVESYMGFIFACLDEEAPPLEEYLGDVGKLCLMTLGLRGENQIVGGVQKYTIGCNWKFAVDNVWDFYHGILSHASVYRTDGVRYANLMNSALRYRENHLVFPGEYGHALGGPALEDGKTITLTRDSGENAWRYAPDAIAAMGDVGVLAGGHPHIFPNMWLAGEQVWLRMPRGPMKTELWSFLLLRTDLADDVRREKIVRASHGNGPAGLWEQDDGENWEQSTRGMTGAVTRRHPLHYALNLGHGEVVNSEGNPPYIAAKLNEHGQLWMYKAWAEWMDAESWADLRANHSTPGGVL